MGILDCKYGFTGSVPKANTVESINKITMDKKYKFFIISSLKLKKLALGTKRLKAR